MRRQTDKNQFRLTLLLMALNAVLSIFAAVIGYKAIVAMGEFQELMSTAKDVAKQMSHVPEVY